MELIDEIRNAFAAINPRKALEIKSLDRLYPGWILRFEDWYGVAVPLEQEVEISEHFASAKIWNKRMIIGDSEKCLLMLTSTDESLRIEFASLCAQFLDPGENGIARKNLCSKPADWWIKWTGLLGNSLREKIAYSVLGELLIFEKLLNEKRIPIWTGPGASSHDIETDCESFEVKSSLGKYSTTITVSGQHQLNAVPGKNLTIVFCRFEPVPDHGDSINDVVKRISDAGHDINEINSKLIRIGYEPGCMARNERFVNLEIRKYKVDDGFPKITQESFIGGKMPESIIQITYIVDLSSLHFEYWIEK